MVEKDDKASGKGKGGKTFEGLPEDIADLTALKAIDIPPLGGAEDTEEGTEGGDQPKGPFLVHLKENADGTRRVPGDPENDWDLTGIWEWSYSVNPDNPPSVKDHNLAHKISRLAGNLQEAGFMADPAGAEFSKKAGPGDLAALDLMEQLVGVFRAALQGDRGGEDLTIYTTMVDDLEKDFFRRVITARMRSKLMAPVRLTLIGFLVALLLGFLTPQFEAWTQAPPKAPVSEQVAASTPSSAASTAATAAPQPAEAAAKDSTATESQTGFPWDLFRALCFVVAGTLMGRLLFFALTHNGRVEDYDQHFALKAQLSAPEVTLLFDVAIGATAFAVFQTGFVVIAIGGEAGNAQAGISSLQIGSDGLIAFVFGVLVGISRIAFLGRIKAISEEQLKTAAK